MTFRSYHTLLVVVLVVFLCLTTTCGGSSPPTPTPTDTVVPTATLIPATPVLPTDTPSPTPTPTPSFTQDGLQYVNVGRPGGDGYCPVALAADPELQRIYVYNSYNNEDGQDTLSVIRSDTLEVTDMIGLGGGQIIPSLASQLLVDDVTHRVYALNGDSRALLILDGQSLDILFIVHGATRVALAPGEDRVYLINEIGQIKILSASDYSAIGSLDWEGNFEASFVGYNSANNGLYLARWDFIHQGSVVVLDGTTLSERADIPLPSAPHALQIDPERNEVYVATDIGVTVIDGSTDSIVEDLNLQIDSFNPNRSMTLDTENRRLYLSYNWGLALSAGGGLIILDTDTHSVTNREQVKYFWQDLMFLPEYNALYAVPAGNESLLVIDGDGQIQQRAMLGLRLLNMQVDPVTGDLWALDSAGTLHVLGPPPKLKEMERRMDIIGTPDGAVEIADLVVTQNGAYLTDEARQRSISIDTQTLNVRQKFQAAGPLAVDTQGQRLFVVDDSIKIYGLGTGKLIGEIPIPTGDGAPVAVGIIYEPIQDRLYLKMRNGVNSSVNYRTFWRMYNGKTGRYVMTFNPDKRDVEDIAIVPEANRLYLAYAGASDWDRGLITYDLDGVELDRIKGLSGQLISGQDDAYLYVLRQSGLWALDRKTMGLVALWPLSKPYEQMVIDHANRWIYLRQGSQITVLSVKDLLEKEIQSPNRLPESIGLPASIYRSPQYETDRMLYAIVPGEGIYRSQDRGRTWRLDNQGLKDLYVTELTFSGNFAADDTIWIKTASRAVYHSADRGETWRKASAWTPTVAFVSVRDETPGIHIMNSDGTQIRRLTEEGINGNNPHWAPEDNWICFDSDHEGNSEIYVIQPDGYGLARLTNDPADDTQPAWSPIGDHIAFVSTRDGNSEIYLMEADGANPVRLTDDPATDRQPSWSPDGNRLVFVSDRDGNDEVYILTLETGEVTRLTTSESQDDQPAWSPDGRWIAFVSDQQGDPDIFRVHPDGTELVQVTHASAAEKYPAWSPDSSFLVVASDRTGNFQLYRMNLTGGDWRRLTMDTYSNLSPAWVRK